MVIREPFSSDLAHMLNEWGYLLYLQSTYISTTADSTPLSFEGYSMSIQVRFSQLGDNLTLTF